VKGLRARRATLADLERLLVLESRFPSDQISRRAFCHLLTQARAEVWVAVADGRVVANAVVLFRANSRRARVYSIVADPAVRRRGVGSQLLAIIERRALARSCDRIGLEVRASAARVINWYRRHGYAPVRRESDYYDDGGAVLRMQKSLRVPKVKSRLVPQAA
jgi:ribosomal protein S18 acetylase RimI-like enzyme